VGARRRGRRLGRDRSILWGPVYRGRQPSLRPQAVDDDLDAPRQLEPIGVGDLHDLGAGAAGVLRRLGPADPVEEAVLLQRRQGRNNGGASETDAPAYRVDRRLKPAGLVIDDAVELAQDAQTSVAERAAVVASLLVQGIELLGRPEPGADRRGIDRPPESVLALAAVVAVAADGLISAADFRALSGDNIMQGTRGQRTAPDGVQNGISASESEGRWMQKAVCRTASGSGGFAQSYSGEPVEEPAASQGCGPLGLGCNPGASVASGLKTKENLAATSAVKCEKVQAFQPILFVHTAGVAGSNPAAPTMLCL